MQFAKMQFAAEIFKNLLYFLYSFKLNNFALSLLKNYFFFKH